MLLLYESRSLRSPFFSLALAFRWSERPSLFLPWSPVRAPPASFIRPLARSIFASSLPSLPPLPPSRPIYLPPYLVGAYDHDTREGRGGCTRGSPRCTQNGLP